MAKFNGKLLLLFIACLFALSQAVPMEDISETDVDITESEISPTAESFVVDVMRTDLLVTDDGELVGERLQCVMIEFELDDDQLLVNNVPVALGVTSISVIEAQIIESPTNQTLTDEEIQELEDDFDIGLVTVELTTSAESYPSEDPSISLRLIKFSIRIIEIDGIDIVETDAIEKFLEVKTLNDDSGDLTSSVATDTADMATSSTDNYDNANPHAPCTFDTFVARLKHWWMCSSRFTRVLITSFVLTSISGILFALVHALMVVIRQRRGVYHQVAANEEDEYASPKNEQVIYVADEEKRALMMNQDKN